MVTILKRILPFLLAALMLSGCRNMQSILPTDDTSVLYEMSDIYVPMQEIRSLNPTNATDKDSYHIQKILYEGLFTLDEHLQAKKQLCGSFTVAEDGKNVTIELPEGISFHGGQGLTSRDVDFSIKAYKQAGEDCLYYKLVKDITNVKIIDDYTFTLVYPGRALCSLEKLTFPILCRTDYNSAAAFIAADEGFIPNGTGPMYVTSSDSVRGIKLLRFTGYRDSTAASSIELTIYPKREDSVEFFPFFETTFAVLTDKDRDFLTNSTGNIVSMEFPNGRSEVLVFNTNEPPLDKKAVRVAIAKAVDRETILKELYKGKGVLNDTIYYPGYAGSAVKMDAYSLDPAAAAAELKASGVSGTVKTELMVNKGNAAHMEAARAIKQSLKSVGLDVTLRTLSFEDYTEAIAAGDYEMYIGTFNISPDYDMRGLLSGCTTALEDEEIAAALDVMEAGRAGDEKLKAFEAVRALFADRLPVLCIFQHTDGAAYISTLSQKANPTFYSWYSGIEDWTWSYETAAAPEDEEQ